MRDIVGGTEREREREREREEVMAATLRQILVLQRDVPAAARFYAEGLGLRVRNLSPTWAEVETGGTRITLRAGTSEAVMSTGYSPMLAFDVRDLDGAVQRLLRLGARLDGPIRYPEHGKAASMRGPDGHMLSLYERASSVLPEDATYGDEGEIHDREQTAMDAPAAATTTTTITTEKQQHGRNKRAKEHVKRGDEGD